MSKLGTHGVYWERPSLPYFFRLSFCLPPGPLKKKKKKTNPFEFFHISIWLITFRDKTIWIRVKILVLMKDILMTGFQSIHQNVWNDKGYLPWILDLILQRAIAYSVYIKKDPKDFKTKSAFHRRERRWLESRNSTDIIEWHVFQPPHKSIYSLIWVS